MSVCRISCVGLLVLSFLLFGIAVCAQGANVQLRLGPVYTGADGNGHPKFPRVDIVLDLRGGSPGNLAIHPSELSLIEEGVETGTPVALTSFEKSGYGQGAIIAIDVSGSMRGAPLQAVRQSLYRFASEERPSDKVAVLTIADEGRWDVPSDSTPDQLRERLQKIEVRGHLTRLYDGLLDALAGFTEAFPVRRRLMVISDGHDEGSLHSEADVIREATRQNISIDTVGVTRSNPKYLQSLEDIAAQTGGSYQKASNDDDLQNLITAGLSELKSSPVVLFETKRIQADGHSHKIGVRWKSASEGIDLNANGSFIAPLIAPIVAPNNPPFFSRSSIRIWVASGGILLAVLTLAAVLVRRKRRRLDLKPDTFLEASSPISSVTESQPSPAALESDLGDQPLQVADPSPRYPAMHPAAAAARNTRILHLLDEAPEGVPAAWLEGISDAVEGKRFPVNGKEFWIGAADNNDLRIDDSTVSGNHACILIEGRVVIIADNNSTNGTRINNKLLRGGRSSLNPGDTIQIGRVRFRVASSSAVRKESR